MADPINTLPGDRNPDGFNAATRANATLNTDASRIGDSISGTVDNELDADDALGYNNPAQSGGVTRAANADVYADTATNTTTHVAATSNDIARDPSVYDVHVVRPSDSVISPAGGTVPPGVSE